MPLFRAKTIVSGLLDSKSHALSSTDVSALGGVHTLSLRGCIGITDFRALGGVHTLNLSHCECSRDLRALVCTPWIFPIISDVTVSQMSVHWVECILHTLNLTFCIGIRDVSALGGVQGVHTLNISGCFLLDISVLGGVHKLYRNFEEV
jgi:hypothetical protein